MSNSPQPADTFRSIVDRQVVEIKVKGSRFIGEAVPVVGEQDVQDKLSATKKREYNATHHCWAYRLGEPAELFRYNDDGEPNGTAGQPILRQIDGKNVTNTLVVVTRYYGGTKLGTGGLVRAYGDAAKLALDRCRVLTHIIRGRLKVVFAYADTSPAMHTINSFDTIIESSDYGDDTTLTIAVRKSEIDDFKSNFIESLAGRVKLTDLP